MHIENIEQFNSRFAEISDKGNVIDDVQSKRMFESVLDGELDEVSKLNGSAQRGNGISGFISEISNTQETAKEGLAKVLMGSADNAHEALINMEKAKIEMQFATTTRDKIVSGVNQMLNMQI